LISVLITADDDPNALTRLLTGLVPAAAEGLVKSVAVIGAVQAAEAVADDAGADLYPAGAFGEAFAKAKGAWVAGIPLGVNFAPDWIELLIAHLARETAAPARLVCRPGGFSFAAKPEGWLVPKRLAQTAAETSAVVVEQDLQRLARRGGRLRVLDRR
jgi:hypothetical protein